MKGANSRSDYINTGWVLCVFNIITKHSLIFAYYRFNWYRLLQMIRMNPKHIVYYLCLHILCICFVLNKFTYVPMSIIIATRYLRVIFCIWFYINKKVIKVIIYRISCVIYSIIKNIFYWKVPAASINIQNKAPN